MTEKIEKRLWFFGIIAAILFVFCWISIPIKINKVMKGIQWKNEDANFPIEEVEVNIQGTYYVSVLQKPKFKGMVTFSNIPITLKEGVFLIDMEISSVEKGGFSIAYFVPEKNQVEVLGSIFMKDAFSEFFLYFNSHFMGAEFEDQILSVPANTREEAVERMKKVGNDLFRAS